MIGFFRILAGATFILGISGCIQEAEVQAGDVSLQAEESQPGRVQEPHAGQEIYAAVCANCHEAGVPRAPSQQMMAFIAPRAIYRALTEGVMEPMAAGLTDQQKVDVVEYIAGDKLVLSDGKPDIAWCEGGKADFDYSQPPRSTGWGMTSGNTREVPSALAGISRENVHNLRLQWAVGFPGTARMRSQPMIAGGALYAGSQGGTLYSLV